MKASNPLRLSDLVEPLAWTLAVLSFAAWAQTHPPNNFGIFGQPRANLLAPLIVGGGLNLAAAWAAGWVASHYNRRRAIKGFVLITAIVTLCAALQFLGQVLIVLTLEPDVSLRPAWQSLVNFITAAGFVVLGALYRLARDGSKRAQREEKFLREADRLRRALQTAEITLVTLGVGRNSVRLPIEDVRYLRAAGNYFEVHTEQKAHLVYGQLTAALRVLPPERFKRVHRSYVVALSAVRRVNGAHLELDNVQLPIGSAYRADLTSALASSAGSSDGSAGELQQVLRG